MASQAKKSFDDNKKDIDRLWTIHEEWSGVGPGAGRRPDDVEVLNRAAIVFITACWEAYVEDVALEGFDFVLANASSSAVVPEKVKALAARSLRKHNDEAKVWDLADSGWKTVLQSHREAVKKKWVSSLNTPKHEQVDALFEALLGIRSVSSNWHWGPMRVERAREKLDDYITARGGIAHRTKLDEKVYKNWGTDYLNHVERLVGTTDEAVAEHIDGLLGGTRPW